MTTEERNEVLEEAALEAEKHIDPEWPNDDISVQVKVIASAIRGLKT